jgi:hypothetical protein
MALTRIQIITEALDNLSRLGSGTTRSSTTLSTMGARWVNRAQVEVARKYDMLFKTSTASTLASTQTYAFPTNLRALYTLICEDGTNSRKLKLLMPWQFSKLVAKPSEEPTNRPGFYVPYNYSNQFELFPIPDAAYILRMRHSCWPTDLSTDAATSDYHVYGIDLDDVLVYLVTSYGYQWLQELVDAKYWRDQAMLRLKEVYTAERDSFPDWDPKGEGFSTESTYIGEYYNDPFVIKEP